MKTELRKNQTPEQAQAATLYEEIGSVRGVARVLGKDATATRRLLKRAGVLKPAAESLLESPIGYAVKGTSTLVDGEGNIKQQWIKTDQEKEDKLRAFQLAITELCKPAIGKAKTSKAPAYLDDDLMAVIPIGDLHVGMLSWAAETGEDYDLRICEDLLTSAMRKAVALAPSAHRCILINCGDWYHSDDQSNRTARSGHQLDVDSRWARVLEVGIRIMRRAIEECLSKFGIVEVDNVRGNHDDNSSFMLSQVMHAYFRNEPRVKVCMSPSLHHYFEFGKCFIATHHGHTAKFESLPLLMAATHPEVWGRTIHRRVYCGHIHSDSLKEKPGCIVETVNTLAARDAYAAGAGYMSGRDLKLDVWHREHGLINRHIVGISQLQGAA